MPDELEKAVDEYLGAWLAGLPPPGAGTEWRRARLKEPGALLDVSVVPWNFVSLACYRALNRAAALLLARVGEQRRISLGSARRALLSGHKDHLPKALRTGIFSEYAIIDRAIKKVSSIERADGIYVLPIVFAPLAQNTDYTLGPITLLSAKEFRARYGAPLAETKGTKLGDMLLDGWCKYAERYDHFMMVQVKGHEEDKARQTAREVGELVLNLIRMVFRFSATDNIRIGDGFVWESSRSAVYFDLENSAHLSLCKGPWGSILKDGWQDSLNQTVGTHAAVIGSLAAWVASGDDATSPVLERLRYASALIAELYSEPHDRVRLVRLISALEALALLPGRDKAHLLALHCAWAGGWGEIQTANDIYDAVRAAYLVRNEVVHGDGPANSSAMHAFHRLEKHLGRIWIGFLHLYALISRQDRPSHARHLRRVFASRIESFFWMPEIL